ncbi:tetratricopeptide repeat protein [Pontixanthobacter aquaemixtae]|uniref:Sel1 repeat family protein n=1 Tax=Pontixanthobacter aquaemixtae TaxID=1958940 RepID=A0A844ZPN7_9SPHN|nr:SEL1-like repeat protein [Pontixanthobacter aquaemixtae]MXO89708.1 hypothetical protein [Pontixanthobacter aquaemixtae]
MKIAANLAGAALIAASICVPIGAPLLAQTEAQPATVAGGMEAFTKAQYDRAAQILKPFADQGNADAQYAMAYMHLDGDGGLTQSNVLAFAYADKAAKQNHRAAQLFLASAYLEGVGTRANPAKGIAIVETVLKADDTSAEDRAEAYTTLAYVHSEGIGVGRSLPNAAGFYKKSYEAKPDKFTLTYLIELLDAGHGGTFEQEVDWYRKLAEFGDKNAFAKVKAHADAGDAHSQLVVGNVYYGDQRFGIRNATNIGDIERNGQLNWEYWERAAKGGIGEAAMKSVGAFTRGLADAQRREKAAYWLKKAPTMKFLDESNRPQAYIDLGDAYFSGERGNFIPRDLKKAEESYRAAKHGDGLNEVAKAHVNAKETPLNMPKGIALFEECVALENAKCQFNLAASYVYGKGVERSYDKALKLFDRSYANGYARAKIFAAELRRLGKLPDVTPDQLVG